MALWRGNIDVSPVLSKDAAVNYISKYAAKAEPRSAQLDEAIVSLAHDAPADGRIQTILSKALNRFIIERDFSAQEVCHQVLGLPMVECSRCFDIISLRLDLTVERVFRAGVWRRPNRDAGGLPAAQENSSSKMEKYMTRPQELENISYLEMVKKYQWKATLKRWDRRRKDAIVLINPSKWYESLRKDPSKPQDGHSPDNPQYQVATRRALMLYVPFRTLTDAADWGQFARSPVHLSPLHRNDDPQRWPICFATRLLHTPEIFPEFIRRLWFGNQAQEVPNEEEEEWDPTPDIPRRRDQEWQTAARTRANQMIGRPRDYFGNRDIDRLHDWNSDLRDLDLPANPEAFLTTQRGLAEEIASEQEVVHPEMLNAGQRRVYDFVVGQLMDGLQGNGGENVIIMGRGGVGKSFLMRALEHGIWQTLVRRFGEERYPSIRICMLWTSSSLLSFLLSG